MFFKIFKFQRLEINIGHFVSPLIFKMVKTYVSYLLLSFEILDAVLGGSWWRCCCCS